MSVWTSIKTDELDQLRADNMAMREELEAWRARDAAGVALLEDDMRLARVRKVFGLHPGAGAVLLLLVDKGSVSKRAWYVLRAETHEDEDGRILAVHLCKVRDALERRRIPRSVIETVWGRGYRMTPPGRRAVLERLGEAE